MTESISRDESKKGLSVQCIYIVSKEALRPFSLSTLDIINRKLKFFCYCHS